MRATAFVLIVGGLLGLALFAASADAGKKPRPKPKVYGTVAKADAAAKSEITSTFFQFDNSIKPAGDPQATLDPGCQRLTKRAFRCDWSGEDPAHYIATGTVRVTFQPFGVDAVLSDKWTCVPEGTVYDETGLDECP